MTLPDLKKQSLDQWLDEVDYSWLNSPDYRPSEFALTFMNFIKLVNGATGESNKTPPVHLAMLDKVAHGRSYVANLCFRGAAKTTLFMEYLVLFCAVFRALPGLGELDSMIYVSDSMDNGVKTARKNIEYRYHTSDFLQEWLPSATFTDNYLEFTNKEGKRFAVKMFGAKTGIRGTKMFGKRPRLAVLDDLVSDDDSKSKASMDAIKDTVYKGINQALDPTCRKVIFNGTPFNSDDILIEAVESGGWDVNVWPVCERFPCAREDFVGAWEDRFTYDFLVSQYKFAVDNGKVSAFMQELMLRITSEEERLVQDSEIRWYRRQELLANKHAFNFYITSDLATSKKTTADYTNLSVWAYNAQGDWFWVDGIHVRQTIDLTWDKLFELVQEYRPVSVGIEVTGQQQAYIKLLERDMMARNIWFTFASSEKNNEPGIRPHVDKLTRFNVIVPWFKAGKMYFPEELRHSEIMGFATGQIRLVTRSGIKGKDDFLDSMSQLGYITPWKPSETPPVSTHDDRWDDDRAPTLSAMSSYIV